jgi:hypothetical protein
MINKIPTSTTPEATPLLNTAATRCEMTDSENLNLLERKLQAICAINDEIIQRIGLKINSDEQMIDYDYLILPEEGEEEDEDEEEESQRRPHQFKVEEIQTIRTCEQIVGSWRINASAELPDDPDPDETLYGKQKTLMNMTCTRFSDLVRINKQLVVALKYTTMLRESLSIKFGLKFQRNFELVQVLLGTLETLLMGTESRLEEKQDEVNRLNDQMAAIFSRSDNVWTGGGPYRFAGGAKEVKAGPYPHRNTFLDKGTLLTNGIHRWQIKCLKVVNFVDLGVVTPTHVGDFGSGMIQAWGIRDSGHIFGSSYKHERGFKSRDYLTFVLNCSLRTLSISINGTRVTTIADIILPVHLAISGGNNSQVEIL